MKTEARRRIDRALETALDLEGPALGAFLATLRRDDAEAGAEVEQLLRFAVEGSETFDRELGVRIHRQLRSLVEPAERAGREPESVRGRRFGAWRVTGELGQGGMSTVHLVERADGAYEQRAALKRISWATSDEAGRRRFQQERQILAGLQHPDIARLLDGGVDEEGRPFLVMELVEGLPIDRACEGRGAKLEERLRLFVRAARAVAFAHRNLVVHRDIKPSNVLVTAEGAVKLLDFGIAAPLAAADSAAPAGAVSRWLTPDYASPEQLEGGALTTASDVYQLGLLLRDLTAGQPRRRPRGDLEAILATALTLEPERRYRSAEALAEDVERHLAGLAITVRSGEIRYRAGRWLARYRWPVAAGAALAALLIAYTVTVTVQAAELRRKVETTQRLSGYLSSLLGGVNPKSAGKGSLRGLVDEGAKRLVGELKEEPVVRSQLQTVLGEVYNSMGLYPQGTEQLEAAYAGRRALYGPDDARTMATAFWLARTRHFTGDYVGAGILYRQILAWRKRNHPPDSYAVTESEDNLACLAHSLGDWARAETELRDILRRREAKFGETLPTANTRTNLADLLLDRGKAREAEGHYRRALATFLREHGPSNATTSLARAGLGHSLTLQGRLGEAERELEETLALRRLIYGGGHPLIAESLRQLGLLRARQGRLAEASGLLEQSFRMHAPLYRCNLLSRVEAEWAEVLLRRGEARAAYEHAEAARRRLEGEGLAAHPFARFALEVAARAALELRATSGTWRPPPRVP